MTILSRSSRCLMLLSLTAGTCFLGVGTVSANPIPTIDQAEQNEPSKSASQLGGAQEIQGIDSALSRPTQDIPTFEIKGKSSRSRRGILGVLGGRFKDEDRHPSFRKLEQQR